MSSGSSFLFKNGVLLPATDIPAAAFLEAHSGAYTTTRTANNGTTLLFWERHMLRLSYSFKYLLKENPKLLCKNPESDPSPFSALLNRAEVWDSLIQCLANDCMRKAVGHILVEKRKFEGELAITTLVGGLSENLNHLEGDFDEGMISEALDVYMHMGRYVPPVFGARGTGAHLAVVGGAREYADAKYSDWVRLRRRFAKLKPPSVTELLLSKDGDQMLEGCVTNFFVVCFKGNGDHCTDNQNKLQSLRSFEVQTAPINNGVLPGIIRQVILDVCSRLGIPFQEVAPSWSKRELWVEAFITNSLRIMQHVDTIQVPSPWKLVESSTWEDLSWVEKRFEAGPGRITSILQAEILRVAGGEALPTTSFMDG